MDPFTQRMLEKAEKRSRALGIGNANRVALGECTSADAGSAAFTTTTTQAKQKQQQELQLRSAASAHASTNTSSSNKLQVVEKMSPMDASSSNTPNKVLRQFSAVDKENMDLGIEINIVTDKDVEVQVQVEEQDITDDEAQKRPLLPSRGAEQPVAKIRDTSRNRLQRLGALYANPNDLSSPIHRTEGNFYADSPDETALEARRPKQRYGKLAALANSINQWEDDTTHHDVHVQGAEPPPKPDLPSRKKTKAPAPPVTGAIKKAATEVADENIGDNAANSKTKQLKWDPKVINSLEAQGFQRRESTNTKLAYDYAREEETAKQKELEEEKREVEKEKDKLEKAESTQSKVGKLASTFTMAAVTAQPQPQEKKPPVAAKNFTGAVKPGLVSGRTAVFEQKATVSQAAQRPQKDPTELSLRERMQLFEKNKGEALVPKAALGMAPSINQIRQDACNATTKKDDSKASSSTSLGVKPSTSTESKLRDKVAAFVANAATLSENKIKADIQKQRQEDMQILANRFNKPKEIFSKQEQQGRVVEPAQQQQLKTAGAMRPPPPPPPPPPAPAINVLLSSKRRSPSDVVDEESKRARKSTTSTINPNAVHRLYPALSDLESNESLSDVDNCCGTTATVSGRSTAEEQRNARTAATAANAEHTTEDTDNESYMESEADDSSADICNGSLGREIMQVVHKKEQQQHQKYGHTQQAPAQQQQQQKQIKEVRYADKDYYYGGGGNCDSSLNSSEGSAGVGDYLDEAFDYGEDDCTQESDDASEADNTSRASRESKGTTASNSFSFRKTPRKYISCQPINEESDDFHISKSSSGSSHPQPIKSELSVNQEDENMVTLVHTVSFYRRQQSANSANSTPVRKICREQQFNHCELQEAANEALNFSTPKQSPTHKQLLLQQQQRVDYSDESGSGSSEDSHANNDEVNSRNADLVREKIKDLLDEVCKQQQVIAQTSQALNLCAATVEFSGSTESVEGERHLLVATHRRQACLDEVQRLRYEGSVRPKGAIREKGRITVKEITVPLRRDYIQKLSTDTISGHHLVCLLKYNEHVLATKTVPTLPGLLAVKFPDVLELSNVYADFRITLEIYGMTAQREVLPHEVKYHINLNKKSGIKTPKKKGSENRLVMPPVQSPAGPHVVRTPALVQYGFAIFSLRESKRTSWTLTQVLGVSPLDGAVHMKVDCQLAVSVTHEGFLTMFEDISGFGAWHRRWCILNGPLISYWAYPGDEKKKAPMGTIDLSSCILPTVGVAPRDVCARLNTILLEFQREARADDRASLIIVPNGKHTIVRYLLSADTKEDREHWCACINKTLTLQRAWGLQQ